METPFNVPLTARTSFQVRPFTHIFSAARFPWRRFKAWIGATTWVFLYRDETLSSISNGVRVTKFPIAGPPIYVIQQKPLPPVQCRWSVNTSANPCPANKFG